MQTISRRLCANAVALCGQLRQKSTSTLARPVYELRIYNIKPECFKPFLDLLAKFWSVRTAHSKSVGFWASEIGGITEAVHIWEYESLSHRAEARKILAGDETWQKEFLQNFFPQANWMNNALMVLAPGTKLCTDFQPSASAVYELHTCESGSTPPPGDANEVLIGKFTGVYGPTGTEYLLLRYPVADAAFNGAMRRREKNNVKGYSRLMVPCAWSHLK